MIRVVRFDPAHEHDRRRFQFTYEGFVIGGAALNAQAKDWPFSETRLEARIARKLEAVSEPSSNDAKSLPTGRKRRGLSDGGSPVAVRLEQQELDALVKRVEACRWAPDFAVDAVDAVDHLMASERVEEAGGLL